MRSEGFCLSLYCTVLSVCVSTLVLAPRRPISDTSGCRRWAWKKGRFSCVREICRENKRKNQLHNRVCPLVFFILSCSLVCLSPLELMKLSKLFWTTKTSHHTTLTVLHECSDSTWYKKWCSDHSQNGDQRNKRGWKWMSSYSLGRRIWRLFWVPACNTSQRIILSYMYTECLAGQLHNKIFYLKRQKYKNLYSNSQVLLLSRGTTVYLMIVYTSVNTFPSTCRVIMCS